MAKAPEEVTVGNLLLQFKKDHGDAIASFGGNKVNGNRLVTGLMALDVAIGGGILRGKCTVIYGPYSSSKTNIALLCIASNQRSRPNEVNVFIDVEHAFDPTWARMLGVDVDKLAVLKPTYAEQAAEMFESVIYAKDIGVVVLDSIASMVPSKMIEKDAGSGNYAGNSIMVNECCRRMQVALIEAEKMGLYPTVILINQIRSKLNVQYGDPTGMPGGHYLHHASSMTIFVFGANKIVPKVSSELPALKEVTFKLKKWKCPITSATGIFRHAMIKHDHLRPGQDDNESLIEEYLKEFDAWKQVKGGWEIIETVYKTQKAFWEKIREDTDFGDQVRDAVMQQAIKSSPMWQDEAMHAGHS